VPGRLIGVGRLQAHLRRIVRQVESAATPAAEAAAEAVARNIDPPKDTGATAASVFTQATGQGKAEAGVGTPYARYPERGTSYQPAQRFVKRAADDSHAAAVSAMVPVIRAAVR
jgi:HK97 gp10 family phage protein